RLRPGAAAGRASALRRAERDRLAPRLRLRRELRRRLLHALRGELETLSGRGPAPEPGRPREGLLGQDRRDSGATKWRARSGDRDATVPHLSEKPPSLALEVLHRLDGRLRLGEAPRQFRIFRAAQPPAAALDRLDHEQVRHGLVVGEVVHAVALWLGVTHCANGTQAIGTPASDWRAFSVAEIQLSPSGRSTDAGRTRYIDASSTLAGATPCSRSARAASRSRRRT